jgi:general secretion pathway protein G
MLKERKRFWVGTGIGVVLVLTLLFGTTWYRAKIQNSREAVLRGNLLAMRVAIDQYIDDRHQAPQSLQQLVDTGYFRELPVDPMTQTNFNWTPVIGNVVISAGQTVRGITDLHSSSSSVSSDGTNYSAW